MKKSTVRYGFTLVELAIVLVIIGIIMGMAIKGKSLIDIARLKRDLGKIHKFEVAGAAYYAKYEKFPPIENPSADCRFTNRDRFGGMLSESDYVSSRYKGLAFGTYMGIINEFNALNEFCVINSKSDRLIFTAADSSGRTETTYFLKIFACEIEFHLDDKTLTGGNGRAVSDSAVVEWSATTYDNDCSSVPRNVKYRYGYLFF